MIPKVRIARFSSEVAANLFQLQCWIEGKKICSVSPDGKDWVIRYYESARDHKIDILTVEQVIVNNSIENFSITFLNGLDQKIIDPNPNIIANMQVKAIVIDWLRQAATITVLTL